MPNFRQDLKEGKEAEEYICNFLQRWFPTASVFYGKKKEYDIEIPEIKEKMEVKYDRMSKDTGNVAIEFEFNGSPSGIEATGSDRWCIIFAKEKEWYFAFIAVPHLKKICEGHRTVNGGDGYMSKMYLLPVDELFNFPFVTIHKLVKDN